MSTQQLLTRDDSESSILATITPILSSFSALTTGSILTAIGATSVLLLIMLIARKVMYRYKNKLHETTNDAGTHPEQFQQLEKAAPASSERNVITVHIPEAPTPRYFPEPSKQIRSVETIEDSDQDTNQELSGVFREKLSSRGGSKKVKSKILKGIAKGPSGSDNSDEQQCVEV